MVQKTDAMLQYEKSAGELIKNRPKRGKDAVMHLEVRNFVVAGAAIFVLITAAASMMGF
ncbi:MAG: hypothetical protein AB9879_12995 [Methanothrix sp.]|jgi:hypothetical protein